MAPISILVRDAVLSQLFTRSENGDLDCTQTDCDDPYKAKVAAAVIGSLFGSVFLFIIIFWIRPDWFYWCMAPSCCERRRPRQVNETNGADTLTRMSQRPNPTMPPPILMPPQTYGDAGIRGISTLAPSTNSSKSTLDDVSRKALSSPLIVDEPRPTSAMSFDSRRGSQPDSLSPTPNSPKPPARHLPWM